MFACRDATELMTEEREGALSGWVRVQFRFHMLICPHCKVCRRQLDEALAVARELPPEEVPPEVEEKAVAAFRTRVPRRPL